MSKLNYVFKPLFIDTFEYNYIDGKTEKSFTIKKKLETKNGKGKMQQSEPLAQFKNDTIKQSNNRAQTSRWLRQSSFAKNSTINSNTPLNNGIVDRNLIIRLICQFLNNEKSLLDIFGFRIDNLE